MGGETREEGNPKSRAQRGVRPLPQPCSERTEREHGTLLGSYSTFESFPGGSVKESAYQAGHLGSIPRWGRSPGEGNGNPFQYLSENL